MASMVLQRRPVLRPQLLSAGRPVVAKRVNQRPVSRKIAVAPQALFGGGGSTSSTSAQFYICVDCGYIFDMPMPWSEVPAFFRCPACNSPKSRFKVYKGGDVKGKPSNSRASMQKRMREKKW